MSKISTYEVAPVPKLSDKLIGTSVGGEIEDVTYNFTLQELLDVFLPVIPANNLQGVLDYGNTATQDINLFGTITTTNLEVTDTANLFITYLNEETHIVGSVFDSADSVGTAGQVLTSTGEGVEWYTLPPIFTPNLQQVLEVGNTADIDIVLDANIQALDVSADTANISTQLSIQGVVVDYNESAGTAGQVLESTVTGVQWTNLPVYSATSPLLFNSTTGVFSIQVANSTQGGYLTANDWVTFNGKQDAGSYITALTGEATATGPGSVPITLNNASVINKVLTGLNVTGGNVVATDSILTAFGKVQNQINSLVGGVQYQGVWNANTNTPTLTSSVGTQGYYYIVSVAGTTNLNGITDWQVGDWAIFSGGVWQKVDNTDSVTSVNGFTGAVSLTTDNIPEGTTNLYFLDSRARAAVSATSPLSYNNTTGVFSIQQASGTQNGYLSNTDWTTFNSKQDYLGGNGLVKSTSGTITYITDNSSNWNTAYNRSLTSAAVTGTGTKTLTLNQQDGGTITASWSDADTGLTSVGLSMPSAFTVSNSPLTSNGTIGVTGAGTTAQYVRGDGSLATFPSIISEAQNLVTEVYNSSGATLTKGTVVYINGGQGNLPTITKAIATGDATSAQTFGVVQNDITNMNNGYVVVSGRLGDLDTRDYTPGQQLYLSSTTAGAWTPTKQYAPAHLVYVAIVVRAHPTQGVVEVMIQNGYEMDELHNVAAQNPDNNDILQYKTSTNLWTKVAGTTTNIAEGTNLYYLDSRARAALSFTPGSGAYNSTTGVITIPTNTNQLTNGAAFITLGSLSASAPLSYNNTTGAFSISQSSSTTDGYLSSTDWNTFNNKQPAGSYVPTSRLLSINGTQYDLSADRSWSVGTVTSVAALTLGTSGIDLSSSVANGTTTPVITLNVPTASAANRGALSAADWSTFNTKVGSVTASSPLASSGGSTPNITIQQASGSQDGYLSSTDWTTFNNKQAAGNYITSLTGEATATGPGAAAVTLNNASVTGKVLTGVNITGGSISASDSILTAFGKVQNQINGLIGSTIYQGTWNAATNTPALASGVGTRGYYYIVNVAGNTNLDGITDWFVGDWAIFDGTAWQQVDNTDAVVSVNGQTGAVSLTTDNIPEGATNQYFLNSRARAALSFTAGSGAYNSTTGVITIPTNTNQLTNGASFITLASLSGTAPIVYSNTTGAISITQAGTASNGYLSSTDWNTFNNKQATITLTTTGTSGAATLVGATLNIPQYQSVLTNPVTGTGTANEITYWTGTSTVGSLTTATYPSLTELSYVKGVTSSIQTQIDSKAANNGSFGDANAITIGGFFQGYNPTNVPTGQTGGDWGLLSNPMWSSNSASERYTFQFAGNLDNNANVFVRKFRYNGSVLQSAWYTLLNSGNYSEYALPLSGGTLTGQLNVTYSTARVIIGDGTNGMSLGLWDTINNRIEAGGRPLYMVSYGGTISIGRSSGTNLVVDTGSVTFGDVNFTSGGNVNAIGANISGVSSLAGVVKHTGYPYKVYENLCAIDNYYGAAGAIAITTNIPWDAGNMLTIKIKGYDYNGANVFELNFGTYAGESFFHSPCYTSNSNVFANTYTWYRNSSNKVVLVLGGIASTYWYQLYVSEFKQGYNSLTSSYADGWTISPITSTTGLSNGTSISNKTYTGGIFYGTIQSVEDNNMGSTNINKGGRILTLGYGGYANHISWDSSVDLALNLNNGNTAGGVVFFGGGTSAKVTLSSAGAGTFASSITASSIIKSGGTSSQFLMADGSVNTSVSPTGSYLPLSGGTLTGTLISTDQNAFWLYQPSNTTDTKYWAIQNLVTSGDFRIRALNDAATNGINAVVISRTGISSVSITLGGALTTSATINSGDSITMGGELYYGGITSNRKLRAYSSGAEGSAELIYSFWNGSAWSIKSRLDYNGNATFIGNITANNFSGSSSGTNTGDQTLSGLGGAPNNATFTDANALTTGGFFTGFNASNVPSGLSSLDMGLCNMPLWGGNNSGERYTMQMFANLDTNTNFYIRKFKYFGSVSQSTWYILLHSGNYSSYALPLSGGTLTGQLNVTYSGARLAVNDGTNGMTIGLWDGANCRIETAGRPLLMVSYGGDVTIGRSGYNNLVISTTSVAFGSASFSSGGVFTGTGLDISDNSLLNKVKYTQSSYRVYRNLARFDNYGNGAGAIAITTNIPWTAANMLTIQVKGYRYGDTPFDMTFACYAGEGNFYSPGFIANSNIFGTYTWYRNSSDKVVLVLGTTAGSYGVQIWVSEYKQGFGNQDPAYADGWSISKITSTSGLSTGVSIPNKTNTGGVFTGTVQTSEDNNLGSTNINKGGRVLTLGAAGYANHINWDSNVDLALNINNGGTGGVIFFGGTGTAKVTLSAAGAGTFVSSVTASAFYESSDSRLKTLIKNDYKALGIEKVKTKLYIKDGKEEVGYYAQDLETILPSAVSKNDAGFLSLSYTQVHTAKIAVIEDEVDVLKRRVTELESKLQKYEA